MSNALELRLLHGLFVRETTEIRLSSTQYWSTKETDEWNKIGFIQVSAVQPVI